jgi:succinyl-diaminopimelate desuccinylase
LRRLISLGGGDQAHSSGGVQIFLKDYLEGLGVRVNTHSFDGVHALTSSIGVDQGDRLILYSHCDVVPPGRLDRWVHPPFEGRVVGGRVYGRGSADMLGGLAAEVFALSALIGYEGELSRGLCFVSVPDEEDWRRTPAGYGFSDWLLRTGRLTGGACIMGEPSGVGGVCVGERGDYWVNLRVRGDAGHGSLGVYDRNVFVRLFRALDNLHREVCSEFVCPPAKVTRLLEDSYPVLAEELGVPVADLRAAKMLESPSMNVGRVHGGVMVNVLPDECEAEVAFCVPIGMTWRQLHNKVLETLRSSGHTDVEPVVAEGSQSDPSYTSPESRIVGALSEAIETLAATPSSLCWA